MGTAYRYWRVRLVGISAGTIYTTLIEMRVASDGSGSNLSITGSGTASASAGTTPELAFDGVNGGTSNAWSAVPTTTDFWIRWDFGSGVAYDIQHFGLVQTNATAITWVFEGSNDASTWERRALLVNPPSGTLTYTKGLLWPTAPIVKPSQIVVPGNTRTLPITRTLNQDTLFARDVWDGGFGTVSGYVKVKQTSGNVPVARRVVLIDEQSNRIIRQTWSRASDGYYEFKDIDATRKFTALAFDYTHNYRAVLSDNVAPA